MLSKSYVLDTNVLLHSPHALFTFSEHTIVIPEVVLEELDRFKSESNDRGANSREVSRIIDQLRARGNLIEGVPLNDDGGVLRIAINHLETPCPRTGTDSKPTTAFCRFAGDWRRKAAKWS